MEPSPIQKVWEGGREGVMGGGEGVMGGGEGGFRERRNMKKEASLKFWNISYTG